MISAGDINALGHITTSMLRATSDTATIRAGLEITAGCYISCKAVSAGCNADNPGEIKTAMLRGDVQHGKLIIDSPV